MLLHAFVWYYTQKVSKKDCKKSCADQRLTYLHLTLANKSHLFFFFSFKSLMLLLLRSAFPFCSNIYRHYHFQVLFLSPMHV